MVQPIPPNKEECHDVLTVRYHINGQSVLSCGKTVDGESIDGWTACDQAGNDYKVTTR